VSLVPPDGLLLEVKGSLHLFNGVDGLHQALANEFASLGVQPVLALAPTPLAALAAARAGKPFVAMNMAQLVGQLTPLPLTTLRWPQQTLERLARMGVRTIGQALRLPRAAFARRFGTEQLATLDRLTGRNPDLPERFTPANVFAAAASSPMSWKTTSSFAPQSSRYGQISGNFSRRASVASWSSNVCCGTGMHRRRDACCGSRHLRRMFAV